MITVYFMVIGTKGEKDKQGEGKSQNKKLRNIESHRAKETQKDRHRKKGSELDVTSIGKQQRQPTNTVIRNRKRKQITQRKQIPLHTLPCFC